MSDCIFCEILKGSVPSSLICRDETCSAFMDTRPVNPGHALVIPTSHAPSLAELDEESGARMMVTAHRIAKALRSTGIRCEGVNLYLADGVAAGQEVFHVHLHVVPRYQGDGFSVQFGPHYGQRPERTELDRMAEEIRRTLPST
jgi:histidine triad (HIT) family protein